jgi:hypothetical protein
MVRGGKRKEYWTSEQMLKDQTKIEGFIWCEDLIAVCKVTQW